MWITLNKNVRKPSKPLLKLGCKFIPWTNTYKYLGVTLDNRLTMQEEVSKRLKEGAKRNLLVFRLKTCSTRTLRSLWIGYSRSAVVYGMKHYWFHLSKVLQNKIAAFFRVSAKKIVGIPLWSKNVISLQMAAIDPVDVFLHHLSRSTSTSNALRRLKVKNIGLQFSSNLPEARQVEINFARWSTGFLYTNQIKAKFDKYPRNEGANCRFGCQAVETREHLLLECVLLDVPRQSFIQGVQRVLGVVPTNLEEALGMRISSQVKKSRIARSLHDFLFKSDLHM